MPLVSAIVLNYRSPLDTVRCVQALLNQTIADELEIIVVHNHSDDESIGTLRARFGAKPVRIIESQRNGGYARGNALGAKRARGKYLLFINPDNALPADALAKMVAIMEADPTIGVLGPALVHPDGSVRPSARPFPTAWSLLIKRLHPSYWQRTYLEQMPQARPETPVKHEGPLAPRLTLSQPDALRRRVADVDWLVGACLVISRALFEKLGGFDQRFFLFFEGMDLCRRCRLAGSRVVYAPDIRVADRRQRLSEGGILRVLVSRIGRIHVASGLKYFWKWRRAPSG